MTNSTDTNIASFLPQIARLQPNEPAVIVQKSTLLSSTPIYEQISFADLDAQSDRIAAALIEEGIKRGTRTVLMVKPSLEFFLLAFAIFKLGAVPVLVDPGMGVRNLKDCLVQARPEAFIGIPKAHIARILFKWAQKTLHIFITVGPRLFWGGRTLQNMMLGAPAVPFEMPPTDPQETAAILFTSGSTGIPKGVVYTHHIFSDQVRCLRELYGIRPGERDLATFPLFALFGPALGMTAIIPDMDATRPAQANPQKIVAAIQKWKATNMFGSPALLNRVGRWGQRNHTKLHSLKRVISAGAPANNETLERFTKLLKPGVEIFTPYGATESLPVCSIGSREILHDTAFLTAQGKGVCVGRPAPRAHVATIKITDDPIPLWDDNLRAEMDEIGEIVVRGPRVTREYFDHPEATNLAKIIDPTNNTFFHRMGDLGYFDEEGRLWFCGRKTHRVTTTTETLFTIPCERIFDTHPLVSRTALVGIGEKGAQTPVLCVELERDGNWSKIALEGLRKELLQIGSENTITRNIKTILYHPGFPVDIRHNAKIFREKLAVWAQEKLK